MFGTDYLRPRQELPIIDYLRRYPFTEERRNAVMGGTAARLLGFAG